MQHRYAGDLGDYAKCGLLRALCARDLHLGMVWYLTDDETHNNDGRHRPPPTMRDCDPAMFDAFQTIGRRRSVGMLQQIDAWPVRRTFFDEPLSWADVPRGQRAAHRQAWVKRALHATRACDVVCFDPDNGLEIASTSRTAGKGPKFAFLDELKPFWQRGQSLVVYQHTNRQGSVANQAAHRVHQLCNTCGPTATVRAVRFRRGSSRLFLIAMQNRHRARLTNRLHALVTGPWAGHFQLCP